MTQFGWPMLLANFRECQRSALDGNRGEEVVAILISPYYRPSNGKWEEIMNGWSANRCAAPKFIWAQLSNAEAVLQEAFDWVQRSSVAADNDRIYAEGLVTSRQTHFSVASFNFVENLQSEGLGGEVVTMVQTT